MNSLRMKPPVLFLLALTLLMLPTLASASDAVRLDRNDVTLHGSLLVAEPSRLLVILHAGSGPSDRYGNQPGMNNRALGLLADGLLDAGVSVLQYDKRGVGESVSAQAESDLRPGHYIDDLVAWVDWATVHYPEHRVVLMGHSEGGLFAKAAGVERPDQVLAVVALAAAGRPASALLIEQTEGRLGPFERAFGTILEALLAGETVEEVPAPLGSLFRPSVQPYLIDWLAMQPTTLAARLTQPLLVVGGSTDLQVTRADFDALAATASQSVWIDGMNHVLRASEGTIEQQLPSYLGSELPLHPELLPALKRFFDGLPGRH